MFVVAVGAPYGAMIPKYTIHASAAEMNINMVASKMKPTTRGNQRQKVRRQRWGLDFIVGSLDVVEDFGAKEILKLDDAREHS